MEGMIRQLKGDMRFDWRTEGLACENRHTDDDIERLRAHHPELVKFTAREDVGSLTTRRDELLELTGYKLRC
jgi:hypothetical protein